MTQIHPANLPAASTAELHFLYEDRLYGDTPTLGMSGNTESATALARLLVKAGVDGRGPQAEPATDREMVEGIPRLVALKDASASGYAVDVTLNGENGNGRVRAVYTSDRIGAGLLVANRPPDSDFRFVNSHWVLQDGLYVQQYPDSDDPQEPDSEAVAAMFDDIVRRVTDPDSPSPLIVEKADFKPYQQHLGSLSFGATVIAPRQPS